MVAWIVLLVLIAAEVLALRWWLTKNLYRAFSNEWAATLYALVLEVDIAIAWVVSMMYEPGGTGGMQLMLVLGGGLLVITLLGTLFLRWVVRLDMTDISDKEGRPSGGERSRDGRPTMNDRSR